MKRVYRRRLKSDTWHFHPACRWWPAEFAMTGHPRADVFSERVQKPTTGELCNICKAKARRK